MVNLERVLGTRAWLAGHSEKLTQQYLPQEAMVRKKLYYAAKHAGNSLGDRMRSVNVRDDYCYQYYIRVGKAKSKHSFLSCRVLVIQERKQSLCCSRWTKACWE